MPNADHLHITQVPHSGPVPREIAQTILEGFNRHYALFRYSAQRAKVLFESASWGAMQQLSQERMDYYDIRVRECAHLLRAALRAQPASEPITAAVPAPDPSAASPAAPVSAPDSTQLDAQQQSFWYAVKRAYVKLLHQHPQPDCAETFFNSVSCRVLHRNYFNNDFLFVRPAVATDYLDGSEPAFRVYYPLQERLPQLLQHMLQDFGLAVPFADLPRDLRALQKRIFRSFRQHLIPTVGPRFGADCQVHVLRSLFFRNKGAYVVGRFINHGHIYPFALALTHTPSRQLEIDALLDQSDDLSTLFSFTRAYFLVDMDTPSAYVSFLVSLLPRKPRAEFYNAIGLQKQGKTLFYRDFLYHLSHSSDQFTRSAGIEGMVMCVFTLGSYPYVFKVIRDRIRKPNMDHQTVKARYQLVKNHDRVGRMADTWEYSHVALPIERFSPELLAELRTEIPSLLEERDGLLIIRHVYIERRMLPLNLYLMQAPRAARQAAMQQYGEALRELAASNIFPGDMLYKNFGLTRLGRLVFYDYDEIQPLTEMHFRTIPPAPNEEAEMASEPWYPVGKNDVFPEEFRWFLLGDPELRAAFLAQHAELLDAKWWQDCQHTVARGRLTNFYPYPVERRLHPAPSDSHRLTA